MSRRRRGPTPKRRPWSPLERAVVDVEHHVKHGLTPPDEAWRNDLYTVVVRHIGHGALHLSLHRHDRAAVRDWRHLQAIKNEIAGPERTAVEVFPPESLLVDASNEYHLWVMPPETEVPFVIPVSNVMTEEEGKQQMREYGITGPTKARQRSWQPGLPTGKGL
jgi:hypothetical protein